MWKEFKEFISRGSVIDMAVGIIMGSAFTAIVNSLVSDILMPIIALCTGGLDFQQWVIPLFGENAITIGNFINSVISFFMIALAMFLMIKGINKLHRKQEEAPKTKVCPYCKSEIDINATRCPHCTSEQPATSKAV
ncbi:MAG: large conductance mechanosensitive channel protein MscL [Clostridia bacterium]|nr:large conductance mechanosensitive channel protein MscL [Clostridia bacterium]